MTPLVLVTMFGVVLMLIGVAIGADVQDRLHEGQRRASADRRREVDARWRALQGSGSAVALAMPTHEAIAPVACHADD